MYSSGWMWRWGLEGRDDRGIVGRCARGQWQTGRRRRMEKHRGARDGGRKNTRELSVWRREAQAERRRRRKARMFSNGATTVCFTFQKKKKICIGITCCSALANISFSTPPPSPPCVHGARNAARRPGAQPLVRLKGDVLVPLFPASDCLNSL